MDTFQFITDLFGETNSFLNLLPRLLINSLSLFMVVHVVYRRTRKRQDFYFSYLAVGTITFLLCFLLNNVKLEMGFALGLFAVFGIIRYRTDAIPIKEMTYLFLVIGISVINGLTSNSFSLIELTGINVLIFGGIWILEKRLKSNRVNTIVLVYEKIENVHQDKKDLLLQDLKDRTGLNITHTELIRVDFLKDIAEIQVFYKD